MNTIVIIGGCGHVGLPLGLALAQAGKTVVGLDLDAAKVERTNAGHMPFFDKGCDELLTQVLASGRFRATTDAAVVEGAEVVITVIGTPLDDHLNPRFDVFSNLFDKKTSPLRDGQLFVLRSTVFPGSTERVHQALMRQGFKIDVAFCPERVAEGVALEEIHSLPQIVAGCSPRAQERAEALFGCLTKDVVKLKPQEAELAKLFTNAWRYIQFAVANQFFMIANDQGLDFAAVHRAMTLNYPRAKGFPSAGFAAGPCLFKDTMQLSAFDNNVFFLGHAAMLVNEGLPYYLVQQTKKTQDLSSLTTGILGMTFKAESDDPRDSLSFKLRKILLTESKAVLCSDPYLQDPRLVPIEQTLAQADLLFIGVPHARFKTLDFGGKPVVDVWNSIPKGKAAK